MKFSRINPVFGVFPSVFCALILGACGEDTSVDFEQYQESGPYCHVSHSSSKAVLDMFYPDELKAKIDVEANAFSKTAEEAIKAVGGNATII